MTERVDAVIAELHGIRSEYAAMRNVVSGVENRAEGSRKKEEIDDCYSALADRLQAAGMQAGGARGKTRRIPKVCSPFRSRRKTRAVRR